VRRLAYGFATAKQRNATAGVTSVEGKKIHGGSVPQEQKSATTEQFRCQLLCRMSVTLSFQTVYLDSLQTRIHTGFVPKGGTGTMDYKIGDKVVYPNHGVGMIEQVSYGVLNGRTERYYMIRVVSSGLRVMVPQTNAEAVGLRPVIRTNDTSKVLGFLEKGKLNCHPDWKHRFKENSERMRTGSLLEVAVVLKSLVSLSRSKPLSFREKKMLERAKYLLVSEMATARNTSSESAETLVVKSLAKAKLQFPVMQEPMEQ
jgi:CarD family transcriptional regulator